MKMKNLLKMEKISHGKYLTISLDFVRFCEGTFRVEEAIINLNEIFDGQEQQSNVSHFLMVFNATD